MIYLFFAPYDTSVISKETAKNEYGIHSYDIKLKYDPVG